MKNLTCNGIKHRSKKESSNFLKERYEQLRIEGKIQSPEGRFIVAILKRKDLE